MLVCLDLRRNAMTADKELIKEVAQELWDTTKKLRPGLPKIVRSQLVLKAPMVISALSTSWERTCLLYTSPSPRDKRQSRMPSSA